MMIVVVSPTEYNVIISSIIRGAAVPDGAVPDGAAADGAVADGAVPDGAVPDGVVPDSAVIVGANLTVETVCGLAKIKLCHIMCNINIIVYWIYTITTRSTYPLNLVNRGDFE